MEGVRAPTAQYEGFSPSFLSSAIASFLTCSLDLSLDSRVELADLAARRGEEASAGLRHEGWLVPEVHERVSAAHRWRSRTASGSSASLISFSRFFLFFCHAPSALRFLAFETAS